MCSQRVIYSWHQNARRGKQPLAMWFILGSQNDPVVLCVQLTPLLNGIYLPLKNSSVIQVSYNIKLLAVYSEARTMGWLECARGIVGPAIIQ